MNICWWLPYWFHVKCLIKLCICYFFFVYMLRIQNRYSFHSQQRPFVRSFVFYSSFVFLSFQFFVGIFQAVRSFVTIFSLHSIDIHFEFGCYHFATTSYYSFFLHHAHHIIAESDFFFRFFFSVFVFCSLVLIFSPVFVCYWMEKCRVESI